MTDLTTNVISFLIYLLLGHGDEQAVGRAVPGQGQPQVQQVGPQAEAVAFGVVVISFLIYLLLLAQAGPWVAGLCMVLAAAGYFAGEHIRSWRYRHREEEGSGSSVWGKEVRQKCICRSRHREERTVTRPKRVFSSR